MSSMLARELGLRGHSVTVATDVLAPPEYDERFDFQVVRARPFREIVKVALRADVIHASGASVVAAALSIASRRPLVVTHHGYQARCLEGLGWHGKESCRFDLWRCFQLTRQHRGMPFALRQLARFPLVRLQVHRAAVNVAVSDFVGRAIGAPRTHVIHNCADTEIFRPDSSANRLSRFLFVGRLVGEKGVGALIDAIGLARDQGRLVEADLVGEGPIEADLRRQVEALDIGDRVRFLGPLQGQQLADRVRSSHAVVVPSAWDEAFGVVAAEALCCGRVAIVSGRGGLPEVVAGLETIVAGESPQAWTSALLRSLDDSAWWKMQESLVPALAGRFEPDLFVEKYLRVYRQALGQQG